MSREKLKPTDGLGPLEIKKIRTAIRLVWQRSHARKLVVKRCQDKEGYFWCENCHEMTPMLKVDHIVQVGDLDDGFVPRMFCPSSGLQGLCAECHKEKTKQERLAAKLRLNNDC